MSGPARDSAGDPATFEEALRLLDDVVARLERGDVGLEEAVALFERGQGYLAVCRDRLAAAQKRIEELTGDEPPPAASAGTASTDEPF